MNETVQGLIDFMVAVRDMTATTIKKDLAYAGNTDVVLKHGRVFTEFAPEREDETYDTKKECFRNAYMIADRDNLTYVEGYACDPQISMPIHHAWTVDHQGRVYDPTWGHRDGSAYVGVPLDLTFVARAISESELWGIFNEHFPYREPMPETALVEVGDPL